MKKGTLRVDMRRLKMSLLKLPNDKLNTRAVVFLLTIMLLPVAIAIAVVVSLGHYNCETGGDEQWSQLD